MCVLILKISHRPDGKIADAFASLACKMPHGVKRMMFQPCTVLTSQWHRIPSPRPGGQCLCPRRHSLLLGNQRPLVCLNLPRAALAAADDDGRPNGRHHRRQRLRRRQRPWRRHPWICVLAPQVRPDDRTTGPTDFRADLRHRAERSLHFGGAAIITAPRRRSQNARDDSRSCITGPHHQHNPHDDSRVRVRWQTHHQHNPHDDSRDRVRWQTHVSQSCRLRP